LSPASILQATGGFRNRGALSSTEEVRTLDVEGSQSEMTVKFATATNRRYKSCHD